MTWLLLLLVLVLGLLVYPSHCVIQLPQLKIDPKGIITQGASSGGDMAIQFHMAFSASVGGVCGQDAQPYHCAVTRFPQDVLLPQSNESSVPHCDGCPIGYTLTYDHCKNHPQWVDVGKLPDYPRRVCGSEGREGCIDDTRNLYHTMVYLSRGECRTYIGGAEINSLHMYAQMTVSPQTQLKYIDKCRYPLTNDDEECVKWVWSNRHLVPPAKEFNISHYHEFDQVPFLTTYNAGLEATGYVYIPQQCMDRAPCALQVRFHGCGDDFPRLDSTIQRYAESNSIVILNPRIKRENNSTATYPNSDEIARGCWDGYGQLSADYSLQSAPHMASVWNMVKHIAALNP